MTPKIIKLKQAPTISINKKGWGVSNSYTVFDTLVNYVEEDLRAL